MKMNKTLTALVAGASIGLSGQVLAVGTTSNQIVANKVTLDYSVGTTSQTAIESTSTFNVDNRIDTTLAGPADSDAEPNKTLTMAYTFRNTGNKDQAYKLTLAGFTAAENPQSVTFYKTQAAADTDSLVPADIYANDVLSAVTPAGTLADGVNDVIVYARVTLTNDVTITDGDAVDMLLSATASDAGGTALDDNHTDNKNADQTSLNAEYIVFAEGASPSSANATGNIANNGVITFHTIHNIKTANLSDPTDANAKPVLSVKVINDPICNSPDAYNAGDIMSCAVTAPASYTPKAIPGALIEYNYTAKNAGSVDATSVIFTKELPAASYEASIANVALTNDTAQTLTHIAPPTALSNTTNDYQIENNKITMNVGTVAKDTNMTVTFTAIVD